MVCLPCILIPVLLYIWHKFLQPFFLPILQRYWNPWGEKKDEKGNVIKNKPEFPFDCTGGKCVFNPKAKQLSEDKEPLTDEERIKTE